MKEDTEEGKNERTEAEKGKMEAEKNVTEDKLEEEITKEKGKEGDTNKEEEKASL
jgi:hypothetical protein